MKILALEFSSPHRSVAVVGNVHGPATWTEAEAVETGDRSNRSFELIQEVLRQARLERGQIEGLAVGLGPGSYTGIRGAIAIAQGWQLARDVRILGVSSVECLAAQAHSDGLRGRVSVVIDAQRGEFYLANYELDTSQWREVKPLRLATAEEVAASAAKDDVLVGPEVQNWFPEGRILFPRAATLGGLALKMTDFIRGEHLEPIYLRKSSFLKAPPPRILPDGSPL
jgi:tRNA threonylcarbamoyladenosine biosynthesis protein TsaB